VLAFLGSWQLQRLSWKEAIISDLDARLQAAPIQIPPSPSSETDNYTSTELTGSLGSEELHVLTSAKPFGPGFRVIRPFKTVEGRLVLLDTGFVPEAQKLSERSTGEIDVIGNLIWPRETNSFTPEPNFDRNIWFARDTEKMAEHLGTEPVMIVLRESTPALSTVPLPVTVNIPNDHLQYAITWFSLMVVWIGMTLLWLWRIYRPQVT